MKNEKCRKCFRHFLFRATGIEATGVRIAGSRRVLAL
jgi:hypothetical protein